MVRTIQVYYLTVLEVRSLKWVIGLCSFWRLKGGISFLLSLPCLTSRGWPDSLAHGPPYHSDLCSWCYNASEFDPLVSLLSWLTLTITLGRPRQSRLLSHLKILNHICTSAKFLFLCKATYPLGWAMWCGSLWGPLFCLWHMVGKL